MDWTYTVNDAIQFAIPAGCSLLLLGISLVYASLWTRMHERIYLGGLLLSICALAYILMEFLIVLFGWLEFIPEGRMIHRIQQVLAVYFLFVAMYFTESLFPRERTLRKVILGLAWAGAAIAIICTVVAFVFPESYVSVSAAQARVISPGDFARGAQGPLYDIRDIFLGAYLLMMIGFCLTAAFMDRGDKKLLLVVIGSVMAPLGAIDDILFFQFGRNLAFSSIRYSRVSVGFTFMILFIMAAVLQEFLRTHKMVEHTLDELSEAHSRLSLSEHKYRKLAEGADQAVFSLSPQLRVLSANSHAQRYFSIRDDNPDAHFFDITQMNRGGDSKTHRQMMYQHFDQLARDRDSVHFHSIINDAQTGEPLEFAFEVDYYENDKGEVEYIGRASKRQDVRLARCVEYEKLKLTVGNYIVNIDDVATRLTANLARHFDHGDVLMMKMGLQEMIINAIEHGNLGISFEEKSRYIADGNYLEYLRERQLQPAYRDRKVSIEYVLSEDDVRYLVTDQGEGFDIAATLEKTKGVNDNMVAHGRGIAMTRSVFDSVKFNARGNKVMMVKAIRTFRESGDRSVS